MEKKEELLPQNEGDIVDVPKIALGQPVPPGMEGSVEETVVKIQSILDNFKSPIIGLEYVTEILRNNRGEEPIYHCLLCDKKADPRVLLGHLTSCMHRTKYLAIHFPTVSKAMQTRFPRNKEGKRKIMVAISKLAEKIEEKFGRLPIVYVEEESNFNKKKDKLVCDIAMEKHWRESPSQKFMEVLEELDNEGAAGVTAPVIGTPPVHISAEPVSYQPLGEMKRISRLEAILQMDNTSEPVIGLEYVVELKDGTEEERLYFCTLCGKKGDPRVTAIHITSLKHRMKYIGAHFPRTKTALSKKYVDPKNNEKQDMAKVVTLICAKIEEGYGRLQPVVIDNPIFEENKEHIMKRIIEVDQHFKEPKNNLFVDIVNQDMTKTLEQLTKLQGSGTAQAANEAETPFAQSNKPKAKEPLTLKDENVKKLSPAIQELINSQRKPIIGMEYLVELTFRDKKMEPKYVCCFCDRKGDPKVTVHHMTSYKHCSKYVNLYFPKVKKAMKYEFANVKDSKKLISEMIIMLCAKIQERYGTLEAKKMDEVQYELSKGLVYRQIEAGPHLRETPEENFVEIVDRNKLKEFLADFDGDLDFDQQELEIPVMTPIPTISGSTKKQIPRPPQRKMKMKDPRASMLIDTRLVANNEALCNSPIMPPIQPVPTPLPNLRVTISGAPMGQTAFPYVPTLDQNQENQLPAGINFTVKASPYQWSQDQQPPPLPLASIVPPLNIPIQQPQPVAYAPVPPAPVIPAPTFPTVPQVIPQNKKIPNPGSKAGVQKFEKVFPSSKQALIKFKLLKPPGGSKEEKPSPNNNMNKDELTPPPPSNNLENTLKWQFYLQKVAKVESDLYKDKQFYDKNPEKHPMYQSEWKLFWNHWYDKKKQEGLDPRKQEIMIEWIPFWSKRMVELHKESLEKKKFELKQEFGIHESADIENSKTDVRKTFSPPKDKTSKLPHSRSRSKSRSRSRSKSRSQSPARFKRKDERYRRGESQKHRKRDDSPRHRNRWDDPHKLRYERELPPKPKSQQRDSPRPRSKREDSYKFGGQREDSSRDRRTESPKDEKRSSRNLSYERDSLKDRKSRNDDRKFKTREKQSIREELIQDDKTFALKDKEYKSKEGISKGEKRSRLEESILLGKRYRIENSIGDSSVAKERINYSLDNKFALSEIYNKNGTNATQTASVTENAKVKEVKSNSSKRNIINSGLVTVLRILTALENHLGSAGPKVNTLLSYALSLEKITPNSSDALLANSEHFILLETVKEKLRGQVLAGIATDRTAAVMEKCIDDLEEVLAKAEKVSAALARASMSEPQTYIPPSAPAPVPKPLPQPVPSPVTSVPTVSKHNLIRPMKVEKFEMPKQIPQESIKVKQIAHTPEPIPVPGIDPVEKLAIAQQIATALINQGKSDVTQEELEHLINTVVSMAQTQTTSTASFLSQMQQQQKDSVPKKKEETPLEKIFSLIDMSGISKSQTSNPTASTYPPHSSPSISLGTYSSSSPIKQLLTSSLTPTAASSHFSPQSSATQSSLSITSPQQHSDTEDLRENDEEALVKNFHLLSSKEQQGFIMYLKQLEVKNPARVDKLKAFMNLGSINSHHTVPTELTDSKTWLTSLLLQQGNEAGRKTQKEESERAEKKKDRDDFASASNIDTKDGSSGYSFIKSLASASREKEELSDYRLRGDAVNPSMPFLNQAPTVPNPDIGQQQQYQNYPPHQYENQGVIGQPQQQTPYYVVQQEQYPSGYQQTCYQVPQNQYPNTSSSHPYNHY